MKKLMIFIIALIPIILIFVVQATTVYIEHTKFIAVEQVLFDEDKMTLNKPNLNNLIISYPAKVLPMTSTNKKIEYQSSDDSIASVSEDGTIVFKGFGEVKITAISKETKSIKDTITFYVTDDKPHKIEITNKIDTLFLNQPYLLETKITPNEALNKNVYFKSSNPQVISVSPVGLVTALSYGKATITAYTEYSDTILDSFEIEVFVPVTGISIDEDKKSTISAQNNIKFPKVNFEPQNASNKNLIYSVKDLNSIATITPQGEINFSSSGTATFIAKSVDGDFSVEFTATFTGGYVISAEIQPSQIDAQYKKDLNYEITISKYPSDTPDTALTFSSSNTNVAIVEDGKIKIVGGGLATITMIAYTSANTFINDYCYINISRQAEQINIIHQNNNVNNSTINIDKPSYQISYTVLPVDHTDNISFSNNNSNIATINNQGYITFTDPGQAIFTISTGTATQNVTVVYSPSGAQEKHINQSNQTLIINYGESFYLTYDPVFNMKEVLYTQSNYDVLNYNSQDKIFYSSTQNIGGTTTITATSSNSNIIKINVIVVKQATDILTTLSSNINIEGVFDNTTKTITTAQKCFSISSTVLPIDATTIEGKTPQVVYKSSNNQIATTTQYGEIEFLKEGTITLTLTVDNISKEFTITSTFEKPTQFDVNLNTIVFEDKNTTQQLTISNFMPIDYNFKWSDVSFSGYNQNIISVSNTGLITSIDAGLTELVVLIGNVSKNINIQVKVKTTSVNFIYNGNILENSGNIIGDSIQFSSLCYPSNASNKQVYYSMITNTDKASITPQGLLTFDESYLNYTVVIRVTTQDSGVYKDITINKIDSPANLTILYNEMTLDKYFNQDSYEEKIVKILPNETATFHIVASGENLLDPQNINPNNIITSYQQQTGLAIQSTANKSDASYITLKRTDNTLKSIATTISFSYGNINKTVDVKFYKITSVEMPGLTKENDALGLEQKRVFGNKSYYYGLNSDGISYSDSDLVDFYTIPRQAYPVGISDTLYWFSDKPNITTSITNGNLRVVNFSDDTQVTITIGNEPNLKDCTVSYSYTFTMVNGINVFDYNGYRYCQYRYLTTILHHNIGTAEDGCSDNKQYGYYYHYGNLIEETTADEVLNEEKDFLRTWNLSNIYGNGHTINIDYIAAKGHDADFRGKTRNVTIKGRNEDTSKKSYIIRLGLYSNTYDYIIFENFLRVYPTYHDVEDAKKETYLTNCLFRHNSEAGVLLWEGQSAVAYLHNTIFYDTGLCAINAGNSNNNLYISGFFDVYNFKRYSEFGEKSYCDVIKKVYDDSDFLVGYVDRSSGNIEEYIANVGIISPATSSIFSNPKPPVNTIYFSDNNGGYLANQDNCTGLNYTFVESPTVIYLIVTKVKLNMWLCRYDASDTIKPGATPSLDKLYRKN